MVECDDNPNVSSGLWKAELEPIRDDADELLYEPLVLLSLYGVCWVDPYGASGAGGIALGNAEAYAE